jgi:hypothetical protein
LVNAQQQVNAETGNIVYTTLNPPPPGAPFSWNGFIVENTGGGGLIGGNIPAYNTQTGTFIFGYMPGIVNYSLAVNFALANAGTGIKVNGFKYSWEYFNQDFSRGTISGNISLTNNKGSVVESYNYPMPQTTQGWTLMSGTQNFSTQYAPASLGNLQVSFAGQDDRFWAGYWGPQVRAIDVRLLYGTASSPSIPTIPTSSTSVIETTSTVSPETQTTAMTPVDSIISTSTQTTLQPVTIAPIQTTANNTNTAPATTTTSTQSNTTTVAAATSTSTRETNTSGTSIGLSVVARNQQREQTIAMQASQTAIQTANEAAAQTQQEALSIAHNMSSSSTVNMSNSTNRVANAGQQRQDSVATPTSNASQQITLFSQPTAQQSTNRVVDTFKLSTTNNTQDALVTQTTPISVISEQTTVETQSIYSLLPPPQQIQQSYTPQVIVTTSQPTQVTVAQTQQIFTASVELGNNDSQRMLLDRSSPVFQTLENKNIETQTNMVSQQGPTVNRNVQNNEAAGNVDINRMAVAPAGYSEYLTMALRDAAFYAPKEVYANQRNVDNARALRALSSDRLHQQLVNLQYERK